MGKILIEDFSIDESLVGAYLLKKKDDGMVEVMKQGLEEGIPYDTFHEVLRNDFDISLEISRTLMNLDHD